MEGGKEASMVGGSLGVDAQERLTRFLLPSFLPSVPFSSPLTIPLPKSTPSSLPPPLLPLSPYLDSLRVSVEVLEVALQDPLVVPASSGVEG